MPPLSDTPVPDYLLRYTFKNYICITFQFTAAENVIEFCNESDLDTTLLQDHPSTAAIETNACVSKPEDESDCVAISVFNSDEFEEEAMETGID